MTDRGPTPDFSDLDYANSNLADLWDGIRQILEEHGRLCGDEIADHLTADKYAYQEQTIRSDILPQLRKTLKAQQFISVEAVPGEDDKIVKKNWILER